MNNKTVHNYLIKERTDHTYDIYVDKTHVATKGSSITAINALYEIIKVDEITDEQKALHKDLLLEINGAVS